MKKEILTLAAATSLTLLLMSANQVYSQTYTINTVVGNGAAAYSGDGGPAISAALNYPGQITLDASGNLYITDGLNHVIRKVNTSGIITTIAGNGVALYIPAGIAIDASGAIFFSEFGNNLIHKLTTSGIITTIAGTGNAGYAGDGGLATSAEFLGSYGVAVDLSGNVYIADRNNHRIRKINTSGIITTIAGNGIGGYSGDGGLAASAMLNSPTGVTTDATGNIYISDQDNNRIRKVNTSGIISTIAGNGIAGFAGDGGSATSAELNTPAHLTIDVLGNIYITEYLNNRIRKINTSGIISTIAGNGTFGFSGDGGLATSAELNGAYGVAVDASGNVYISDSYNNRIRKLSIITGIEQFASNSSEILISSNPNAGVFQLKITNLLLEDSDITVIDNLGREVYHLNHRGSSYPQIDISGSPNGLYYVTLTTEGKQYRSKVLVIK